MPTKPLSDAAIEALMSRADHDDGVLFLKSKFVDAMALEIMDRRSLQRMGYVLRGGRPVDVRTTLAALPEHHRE